MVITMPINLPSVVSELSAIQSMGIARRAAEGGKGRGGDEHHYPDATPERKYEIREQCKKLLENPTEDDLRWLVRECPEDEAVKARDILRTHYASNSNLLLILEVFQARLSSSAEIRKTLSKRDNLSKDENMELMFDCRKATDRECTLNVVNNLIKKPSELTLQDIDRITWAGIDEIGESPETKRLKDSLCGIAISKAKFDDDLFDIMREFGGEDSDCGKRVKEEFKRRGKWGMFGYHR
ncbi:MAG: hypothetical protein MUP55_03865 [Candidatus Aenigmarchaeota archaeon]|nr:hypothetical protein [Candidatus Aenigmarchaeota archaeon]